MVLRKIVAFTFFIVGCINLAGAADSKQIVFGTDPTSPPFESRAADGTLVGFDIDLGNEICRRLQVKCAWVSNDFDGIILALKSRKFDAILSEMFITDERKKEIDFSDRLYNSQSQLIARKGSKLLPNPQSLAGKTVGVQQGTVQETYAKKFWDPKGTTVSSYGTADAPYVDLVAGRLDAVFGESIVAEDSFLKTKDGSDFSLAGPAVKDKAIFGDGCGIGFRKEDAALRKQMNVAIAAMVNDGTFKKIAAKYFSFDVRAQ